ncbi:hypothetical protein GV789_28150, partial [Nocardia cyriacigeorgica]|nr:hypothetical protein [Nocardia cyriacigeorgica]
DFVVEDYIDGVSAFLGGTANVIMQLGLRPGARGRVRRGRARQRSSLTSFR